MIRLKISVKPLIILSFILFAMDALGRGWYIFGAACALTILYLLMGQRKLVVDRLFMWVVMLSVSNFLIMFIHSSADIVTKVMKYLLSPIGGYFIGTVLASESEKEDDIFKLYMYAVVPLFIHGALNMIGYTGIDITGERVVLDFWNGIPWKATLACTYFAMAVPLVFLSFTEKGILRKLFFFALTAFSVYASFTTASRTVMYIGAIVIVLQLLLYVFLNKETDAKQKRRVFTQIIIVAAIVTAAVIASADSLSDSYFFKRMFESDMEEEPRIQLFMNIIKNTLDYPFGNMPYFYSHNTWLDYLRESGWITFICFFAITVHTISNLIAVYKRRSMSLKYRVAVVGMMVALLLQMFVEPLMDGSPILLCVFFYNIGVNNVFARKKYEEIGNV